MALPPATAEDTPARETADGYFSPLAPAKYVLLAIFKWGRTPVAIPARVVVQGDRAYFQTWSTSRTCKRLRHNDWVQVAPCAAFGLYRYGPWLDATARLLAGEGGRPGREEAGPSTPWPARRPDLAGLPAPRSAAGVLRAAALRRGRRASGPRHHRPATRDVARDIAVKPSRGGPARGSQGRLLARRFVRDVVHHRRQPDHRRGGPARPGRGGGDHPARRPRPGRGRGLSRGRGEGRQNRAPARCGAGGLSARLDGVNIRTDQQRGDLDDSKPVHTSPPGAAGSAARGPRAQAHQRPAGPDVGSLLAGRGYPSDQ